MTLTEMIEENRQLRQDKGLLKISLEFRSNHLKQCEAALVERDEKNSKLKEENVALWLQLATLLEVAEECSITNTKTEALVILEAYKDSFNINKGV